MGEQEGLWVAGVVGLSVFSSRACPCSLESRFLICQGVRCGMQMDAAAACMHSEWLMELLSRRGPPLNELTLKCYYDSERGQSRDYAEPQP